MMLSRAIQAADGVSRWKGSSSSSAVSGQLEATLAAQTYASSFKQIK